MVTKTIKFDEEIVRDLEKVIRKLNENIGVDLYDFSNIVRIAVKQYLDTNEIKQLLGSDKELLFISESSLSKDWLRQEEDEAWADL